MKKILMVLGLTLASSLFALDCDVYTSPVDNKKDILDTGYYANSVSKMYKDENGKYQFRGYSETYTLVYTDMITGVLESCKKKESSGVGNIRVTYTQTKDTYDFMATYDILKP